MVANIDQNHHVQSLESLDASKIEVSNPSQRSGVRPTDPAWCLGPIPFTPTCRAPRFDAIVERIEKVEIALFFPYVLFALSLLSQENRRACPSRGEANSRATHHV
jgi:hypothetical protein